jgi:MFS family permease
MSVGAPRGSARSLRALEWLNAIVADVRAGVGPYLAIYLRASRHWDPAQIGLAMSAMDVASVLGQTPAGALTDRARGKRLLVVAAAVGVATGSLLVVHSRQVGPVIAAQAVIGAMAALFPTAIAAITLGLVGRVRLPRQVGRNETWNHAGNIATAILAGLIGSYLAPEGIFYLVVALSIATIAVVLTIPGREIDHMEARGALDTEGLTHVSSVRALLMDRRIGIFGLCAVLFHFANAAMLPLVGQVLSLGKDHRAPLYMSACIITAQFVMVPVAAWAGRACAVYGRKWVLMIGFSVLPIRGVLYTLTADPIALIAVQILDGVGAGIFGVASVLVVADLTRGTGRFNLTNGAIGTATSLGASLSHVVSGLIVQHVGYDAAFLALSAVASIAVGCLWIAMPETSDARRSEAPSARTRRGT